MRIVVENLQKNFNNQLVFQNLSIEINAYQKIAFVGPNGSGKSTALLCLAGFYQPSKGKVDFINNNSIIEEVQKFSYLSIASPYLELPENFSALEIFNFQSNLKPFSKDISPDFFFNSIKLTHSKNTPVKFFSSGMKQILKLGLAIFADTPILFLDEPCSNLDENNILIFNEIFESYAHNKTVLIGTNNHPSELALVQSSVDILKFKT
ncbi:MAG: ATP-binding cassette domain-containing protein [Bacteroidota bacterium]